MKKLKWLLRIIIILPFILGIPYGFEMMNSDPLHPPLYGGFLLVLSAFGVITIVILCFGLVIGLACLLGMFFNWLFD